MRKHILFLVVMVSLLPSLAFAQDGQQACETESESLGLGILLETYSSEACAEQAAQEADTTVALSPEIEAFLERLRTYRSTLPLQEDPATE